MNRQELIKKYEEILINGKSDFKSAHIYQTFLRELRQLNEPQKVTIPQFVADYIKDAKYYEWDLDDAFDHIVEESEGSEISEWFYTLGNVDVFARAWLDGYTVEKEKRYRVKAKGVYHHSSVLKLDSITGKWFFLFEVEEVEE
ncbi:MULTISPECIES: DUF1642 domain-containing protein [unclassified Streptococcus]|uniref:DUF1642 domain-containing protein n=1 Tax=unclassified Streptococcus TaxID=2608887 RepID=UPI00102230F8|nr:MULTISPECIES: DUF1642 domain-containing protein [unclassified Streptococcus]MTQ41159.1 DUF1642 domain-containing protein [Streptococcus sp. BIOML-A1]RYS60437.1 DUF1642 domain-containing protein [Streptococcus sp. bf_0095]